MLEVVTVCAVVPVVEVFGVVGLGVGVGVGVVGAAALPEKIDCMSEAICVALLFCSG